MAESGTERALNTWSVPECPFTIEYSARALDDIRLAVTDAFFSLPRGGAEIGGILLGKFEGRRLLISDYAALDCEHAFGPSFTISENDAQRLKSLLADAPGRFPGLRVVGWYHSHTRSEVFLSEADLEIHRRFFPDTWQIAMVMRPHTFLPARIGFFFREPDGEIHASSSYKEDVLEAIPMRPVPGGTPTTAAPPEERLRRPRRASNHTPPGESQVIPVEVSAMEPPKSSDSTAVAPVADPVPEPAPEPASPQPQAGQPSVPRRSVAVAAVAFGLTLAVIGMAVKMRAAWLPRFTAIVRPSAPAPAPPPSLGLKAIDHEGQLEINWDRSALPVRRGIDAVLEIADGGPLPRAIQLDAPHLQAGTFTYARQSEKVDVKLIVHQPDGLEAREVTSFLGKMPERRNSRNEDADARRQRDELAAKAAKLKTDLNWQAVKTKKLEKDLQTVREELRVQQQRRLANQAGDTKK